MKREVKINVVVDFDINHAIKSVWDALQSSDNVTKEEQEAVYCMLLQARYKMCSEPTQRAIRLYGTQRCIEAFKLHQNGNGANTVGSMLGGFTTRRADAMINAGREILSL